MSYRSEINIYNIDCMEFMKKCKDKSYDLAIVDPPYRDSNAPTKSMRKAGQMKTITGRPKKEYWDELLRISKHQIVFGANNFQLPPFKGFVVWDKVLPFDFTMSMAEIAAISEDLGTISKIYKLRVSGAEVRIHPNQKPVKLYKFLLHTYAKEGWKIFDSHIGSGSIAVACDDLKFDLDGCEIDEKYYNDAISRLNKARIQLNIF